MDIVQKPQTIKQLRTSTPKLRNLNEEYVNGLSILDKSAVWVTDRVGTVGFFFLVATWTVVWLLWNTLGPANLRFDPYPAFVLWLFISNMVQLFLLPLLLIGQNLQEKYLEKKSEIEYDLNLKSEKEIEIVLSHLEYQNEMITQIIGKIENLENKPAKSSKKKIAKK